MAQSSQLAAAGGRRMRPNYPPHMTLRSRTGPASIAITGLVDSPLVLTVDDLITVPGSIADLGAKVEGFSGEAAPLNVLLDRAQPTNQATHGTVLSDDGHYKASIPLGDLTDKGWLAFRLDGTDLPRDMGGPLRVVVPQGRTLCWNVKGVVEIRLTAGPEPDSVPANPKH